LCNPVGNEYYYSHQALRQLATRLARHGYQVLRFDYFGTGDSIGEEVEAAVERWMVDISEMIDEVKQLAHCEHVTVVGLRMGAALCWKVVQSRNDVKRVVLWEPVLDGKAQLEEWRCQQAAHDEAYGYPELVEQTETLGISLPSSLIAEIESVRLSAIRPCDKDVLLVANSSDSEIHRVVSDIEKSGAQIVYKKTADGKFWLETDLESLVPGSSLSLIVDWIAELP